MKKVLLFILFLLITSSAYAVDLTFQANAGLSCSTSSPNFNCATASDEADFIGSGALTCGASTQGKTRVHTTPLQYCDNNATPTLRYTAYGDTTGDALAGDTATSFFDAGTIEHERGGLEADVSSYSGLVGINSGAAVEADTSAELITLMDDETGTGSLVFGTGPTISGPILVLPDGNGSAPTTDGQIKFDRSTERLQVGDGAATNEFYAGDPILESELTNESTLETQLGSINVIVSTEIDTKAELETVSNTGDLAVSTGDVYTGVHDFGGATIEVDNGTVASLPVAGTAGRVAVVTDGNSDSDCTSGGGSTYNLCIDTGAAWTVAGDGTAVSGADSISIDSSAVVDPDFVSTGDIDFINTSNTVTANINADAVGAAELSSSAIQAGDYPAAGIDGDDINSNLAGRSLTLTAASPDTLDADAELYTEIDSIVLLDPTTSETNEIQHKFATAITITRVSCSTDTGTVTIQFDERAEGTPNTSGTDVMTSSLVCDNDSQATTSFTNAGIAADAPINLQITATASSPNTVRIHIDYTKDD